MCCSVFLILSTCVFTRQMQKGVLGQYIKNSGASYSSELIETMGEMIKHASDNFVTPRYKFLPKPKPKQKYKPTPRPTFYKPAQASKPKQPEQQLPEETKFPSSAEQHQKPEKIAQMKEETSSERDQKGEEDKHLTPDMAQASALKIPQVETKKEGNDTMIAQATVRSALKIPQDETKKDGNDTMIAQATVQRPIEEASASSASSSSAVKPGFVRAKSVPDNLAPLQIEQEGGHYGGFGFGREKHEVNAIDEHQFASSKLRERDAEQMTELTERQATVPDQAATSDADTAKIFFSE